MNWDWLCRVGLHRWTVTKRVVVDVEYNIWFEDRICTRDACGKTDLRATEYEHFENRKKGGEPK